MNDFHASFYKARAHRAKNELDLAENYCAEALRLDPTHLGALSLYGDIKSNKGHHLEARDAFAAAAKIAPKNTGLLVNLASVVKDMGDFDEARDILKKAIAIDKRFAPAYYTLAGIHKFEVGDPLIDEFVALKKRTYSHAVYRCVACFALGKIYNDIGEWDLAFANYQEGNQRRGGRDEFAPTRQLYDAIEQYFTPQIIEKGKEAGNTSVAPVFIVGMPRSGSSLIEEFLSRADEIEGLGEPQDINNLFTASYERKAAGDEKISLHPRISGGQFFHAGDVYLDARRKIAPDAERLIDKNLLNHALIGFIRLLFPKASLIHATRDPIDTCLSCYFQNFTEGHDYSFDLASLGRQYALYAHIMKHWDGVFGSEIYTASYERMIENKDAAITDLFAHIKMPVPDPDRLAAPAHRTIPTASAWQARQPIYGSSVKRWKNYEKHLGPLFQALENAGFGYSAG